jgi:hypothetical protein
MIYDRPDDRQAGRIVRVPLVAPAAGGSPVDGLRVERMVIRAVGGDWIDCVRADELAGSVIRVAKPWDLQRTPWHELERSGLAFDEYADDGSTRRVSNGSLVSRQKVLPPYYSDRELWVISPVSTGVAANEDVEIDQPVALPDGADWVREANSGWVGTAFVHAGGSNPSAGSGRILVRDLLTVGAKYGIVYTQGAIQAGGAGPYPFCGTEQGPPSASSGGKVHEIRCQGNGDFGFYCDAPWWGTLTGIVVTLREPTDLNYLDLNCAGRQWAEYELT